MAKKRVKAPAKKATGKKTAKSKATEKKASPGKKKPVTKKKAAAKKATEKKEAKRSKSAAKKAAENKKKSAEKAPAKKAAPAKKTAPETKKVAAKKTSSVKKKVAAKKVAAKKTAPATKKAAAKKKPAKKAAAKVTKSTAARPKAKAPRTKSSKKKASTKRQSVRTPKTLELDSRIAKMVDAHGPVELPKRWSAETPDATSTLVEDRRGIGYLDESGNYIVDHVLASPKAVASAIQKIWKGDLHADVDTVTIGNKANMRADVFRLDGHKWTAILQPLNSDYEIVQKLSKKLRVPAVNYGVSDTAGAIGYRCFENGRMIESFEECCGDIEFDSRFRTLPEYKSVPQFIHTTLVQLGIYIPVLTPGYKATVSRSPRGFKLTKTKICERLDVVTKFRDQSTFMFS